MPRRVRVSGYARVTRKPSGTVVITRVRAYRRRRPAPGKDEGAPLRFPEAGCDPAAVPEQGAQDAL
jgi:hypothetical protein